MLYARARAIARTVTFVCIRLRQEREREKKDGQFECPLKIMRYDDTIKRRNKNTLVY